MELKIIVESKNFEHDKEFNDTITKNPCEYCFLGQGIMCAERKYCRWKNFHEIYIKKEITVETP